MKKSGRPKKTARQYEQESVRVGKCLIHKTKGAARAVYMLRHGRLPSEICVCHKCDVPRCIRDSHHFVGTQADNMKDMQKKGRMRHTEETKLLLADYAMKQFAVPGARAEMSAVVQNHHKEHPETRLLMSDRAKKRFAKPLEREKLRATMQWSQRRPEIRAKLAAGATRRWAKQEERDKVSATAKVVWADPVFHKKQVKLLKKSRAKPECKAKTKRSALLRCISAEFIPHVAKCGRICSECGKYYKKGSPVMAHVLPSGKSRKTVCSKLCYKHFLTLSTRLRSEDNA